MIKTFRGLLADGAQDTIVLHTNDGSTGYRIVKFELMAEKPMQEDSEHIVQIFTTDQGTITAVAPVIVDFSNDSLLACSLLSNETASHQYPMNMATIFDNKIFNQDIFITHTDVNTTKGCNYYIELEQMKLDLSESTVATLKDVRNETQPL